MIQSAGWLLATPDVTWIRYRSSLGSDVKQVTAAGFCPISWKLSMRGNFGRIHTVASVRKLKPESQSDVTG